MAQSRDYATPMQPMGNNQTLVINCWQARSGPQQREDKLLTWSVVVVLSASICSRDPNKRSGPNKPNKIRSMAGRQDAGWQRH